MFTLAFWKAAGERALKTFAQSLLAIVLTAGTGLLSVAWLDALSVAALAAVVSILTSIGSAAASGGGPSITNAEAIPDTSTSTYTPQHAAPDDTHP